MKVVVTGGAGFIGANLCRRLLVTEGVDEVVALDDLSSGAADRIEGTAASLVVADMGDPAVLDDVLPGTTVVVHLGARPSVPRSIEDPRASHHANATGTLEVLTLLEELLGHPIERVHVAERAGDVRDSQADQTRLRSLFGSVEPIDLREGLARTVEWFRTGEVR